MNPETLEQVLDVTSEQEHGACGSEVRAPSTAEKLTSIWERLFDRAPINPEESFFDLGGNPPLAFKLFSAITDAFGRELPPTTIYSAPTISALTAILDRPTPPQSPSILLRLGTEERPVFITHGLGSSIMEFFDLVKHLRTSRPIYGLQTKGSDGTEPPSTRIEDMAAFRLDAIRAIQPRGPYLLAGYSLGGIVAFEMARQLLANGEKVASLVMIESYPRTEPLPRWKPAHLAIAQSRHRASDLWRSLRGETDPRPLIDVRERARISDFIAWARYKPGFYDGKITFVRAEESHYPEPTSIWTRLATSFEMKKVPGDHHTCLSDNFEHLGVVLSRHFAGSSRTDCVHPVLDRSQ